jgi:hypothetical protein
VVSAAVVVGVGRNAEVRAGMAGARAAAGVRGTGGGRAVVAGTRSAGGTGTVIGTVTGIVSAVVTGTVTVTASVHARPRRRRAVRTWRAAAARSAEPRLPRGIRSFDT